MGLGLEGRTVLLTGAAGGVGRAVARALDARGAGVVLSGRRVEGLEQLRRELGGRPQVLQADLADRDAVADLVERAGQVDVLVANAALPASGPLEGFTPTEIDRALDVNLRAPVQLARALAPAMIERRAGHLVFISSMNGKLASPRTALYAATKFGLRGFAQGLGQDLHGTGVGVTTVFPTFVSEAGMFAEAGVKPPRLLRAVAPTQVADAVIRGIESGRGEVDVAPLATRVSVALGAAFPALGAAVQVRFGGRRLADDIARGQAAKR